MVDGDRSNVDKVVREEEHAKHVVAELEQLSARDDRIGAVECYRAYEAIVRTSGGLPDDRVVEAYRAILWREQPKERLRGALPTPTTPFFGRSREVERVSASIRERGTLLCLTGVAGVGKTRLALAVAQRVREQFPDDLRYIEVRGHADVAANFAQATGRDELRALIVVDNAEAAIDQVRTAIVELRAANPRSSILVTSREAANVPREIRVRVEPFALPVSEATPAVIARAHAVAFFIERATLSRPDLAFDAADAEELAAICAALDGLPLALELAASQLRFFSLAELRRRIARDNAVAPSLGAALKSTIETLDRDERLLFERLALFEAPFTMTEAEAVCSDERLPVDSVFPALARLVERSLVQTEARDRLVQYRLLETIRRVALHFGETERASARARAVAWYLATLDAPGLDGIPDANISASLDERREAIRCVLDRWCDDDAAVVRAIASTRKYWEWRGFAAESLARLELRLARINALDGELQFAAARTIATHALAIGDNTRAENGVAKMRELCEPSGDTTRQIEAWNNAAILAYNRGEVENASEFLERVAGACERDGKERDRARALINLAIIAMANRDWAGAERRLAAIAHLTHGPNEAVVITRNRAYAAAMRGEIAAGRAFAAEAVKRCENPAVGLEWRIETRHAVGIVAFAAGEPYEAIRNQQMALLIAPRLPFRLAALPLEHLAIAAMHVGKTAEAAQLLAYVNAERERTGLLRSSAFEVYFRDVRARLLRDLGPTLNEYELIGSSFDGDRAADLAFTLPTQAPRSNPLDRLTAREREIAASIGRGATNREIAAEFTLSVKTVDNHVAAILAKLGLARRSHVAILVRESMPVTTRTVAGE